MGGEAEAALRALPRSPASALGTRLLRGQAALLPRLGGGRSALPGLSLGGLQPAMLSSSCPEPQRCHTQERDTCLSQQGMLSRPFGSSWAMGHIQGGEAGTGCLPGNVLTAPGSSFHVCCHQQTHRAEAQLCLGPGLVAQGGLSPFTRGGSQSSQCRAVGSQVQPHPHGQSWMHRRVGPDPSLQSWEQCHSRLHLPAAGCGPCWGS